MSDEEQTPPPTTQVGEAVAAAVADEPPPPPQEKKLEILPCPCGQRDGKLILEVLSKGAKLGQVRSECCGTWAVEFINNTQDPQKSFEKAVAAWNAAPRAA